MAKKQYLLIASLILGVLVVQDAYKIHTMKDENQSKISYLQNSLVPGNSEELLATKAFICINSLGKSSLATYCDRTNNLNLTTFQDSIIWEQFIDRDDLPEFARIVNAIPILPKDRDLETLRNKNICVEVLIYLSTKVSNTYWGCSGPPQLLKDEFNNITLFNFEPTLNEVYINGNLMSEKNWSTPIPKSNTLSIEYEFFRQGIDFNMPLNSNRFNSTYTIDLSKL